MPDSKKKLTRPRADNTRKAILNAAKLLFSRNGYAGTKILAIAEEAGVNHSLIFHHFGNKKKLWVAVKQQMENDHHNNTGIVPSVSLPWPTFIKTLVVNSITFYQQSGIIHLIQWQRVEGQSKKLKTLPVSKEMTIWLQAIEHYQDKGDINQSFEPLHVVRLICSITSAAAWDGNVFSHGQSAEQAYHEFCEQAIMAALA